MYLAISIVLSIILLTLGGLVLVRSGKKPENVTFSLLCIVSSVWILLYALIDFPSTINSVNLLNKASYATGVATLFVAVSFTFFFPKKIDKRYLYYFLFFSIVVFVLSFTELISGVARYEGDTVVFGYGALIPLYLLNIVLGIVLVIRNIIISRKDSSRIIKHASTLILIGYVLTIVSAAILAVVLPGFFAGSEISNVAPASFIFLILSVFVSMRAYKLFDLRRAIAIAFLYVTTSVFLLAAYIAFIGIFQVVFLDQNSYSFTNYLVNAIVTFFLVLTYPMVKKRFDKFTDRIFYRDKYDAQEFLGALNKTLVSGTNIETLLLSCSEIVQKNLKAVDCHFLLRETSYFSARTIGVPEWRFEDSELDKLNVISTKLHKKVHYLEDEPSSDVEEMLNQILRKRKAEIFARIVSTMDYEVAGLGYIFIGPRKSGTIYSQSDLNILSIIVDELVIAIQNALRFEEIEQFNVTLQKKIDEATNELKRSNDKLKALDEAKDEFVSMASHQLRTPLTSIKGYISMVVEGDAGEINDTQKQMLGQALFSSQRMVYLISDLLNVSRLKTGKFIIEAKPVYLPNIVESELTQLHEGAAAKNITLAFVKPKSFPTLNLDDMKIRQVIMNFTDNAIYYTPSGGKITVALKDKKESVEFTVKDTGIGVPKAERHKLFAKFYRAENARKARPDGTGLGLFMAKKVIVAQGGSVLFDSKEGKGSTFGFSFPKKHLLVEPPTVAK